MPLKVSIEASLFDNIVQAGTLALALTTVFLWWSTRRLVIATDKSTQRQLRPYISQIDFQRILFKDSKGKPECWSFKPIWMNSGKTFTQNMHNYIYSYTLSLDEEHPDFPPVSNKTEEVFPTLNVAPGMTMLGG